MKQELEQLRIITEYLKLRPYSEKLLRMQRALDKKEYLLTVMGQFSAGKSCLINNILGKKVLPVHITETTAAITFIRYGEEEYASLCYGDGTMEDISIEESLELLQSGGNSDRLFQIEQINIYVNNELLKNGLVIADTPGVNTIINKHIELPADIVEVADRVLYVMGKSVTDTDLNFINSILRSGVKILFVRTHMDELKNFEESAASTVSKEKAVLEKYTEDDMFFVSSQENDQYYDEIKKSREYVFKNIAEDVEHALEKSVAENISLLQRM